MPKNPHSNRPRGALAKRARGAPLGNTNNLKHGFYSRRFSPAERRDLAALSGHDPYSEVLMLRTMQRRLFEKTVNVEDIEELRLLLYTFSKACLTIDRLLRTRLLIEPPENPLQAFLSQALEETLEEHRARRPTYQVQEGFLPHEGENGASPPGTN